MWSVVGFFLLHIVTICVESFSLNILTIRKICFVAPGSKAVREITLSLSETLLHCFAVSLVSKTMCPTNVSIVHLVVTQLCAASFSTLYKDSVARLEGVVVVVVVGISRRRIIQNEGKATAEDSVSVEE